LQELQRRQQAEQEKQQKMALALYRNELFGMADDPRVGAAEPGVTIIEFFDYKCGYCKSVAPSMEALVAENTDVQVILKEFPILGEESVYAARVSLAARDQENYYEFHKAMMNARGSLTEDVVKRIAESVGINFDEVKEKMASEEIEKIINRNYQLAKALGISGTPAFIIGDQLYPGVLEKDMIQRLIAEERAG
jgi:protein-disulfide isomerase